MSNHYGNNIKHNVLLFKEETFFCGNLNHIFSLLDTKKLVFFFFSQNFKNFSEMVCSFSVSNYPIVSNRQTSFSVANSIQTFPRGAVPRVSLISGQLYSDFPEGSSPESDYLMDLMWNFFSDNP